MRSHLLLIPAAIIASATTPAGAKIFMGIEEAQQLMFPGETFSENFITLDQEQFNAIINDSQVNVYSRKIKAWRISNGGWFIIDLLSAVPWELLSSLSDDALLSSRPSSANGRDPNGAVLQSVARWLRFLRLLRLMRVLRVLRLREYLLVLETRLHVRLSYFALTYTLLGMLYTRSLLSGPSIRSLRQRLSLPLSPTENRPLFRFPKDPLFSES